MGVGVVFGPASCARLKKSATHRRLAESSSVTTTAPDQEKKLVSDSLVDEKDKIEQFIEDNEAKLKKSELNLKHLQEKHKHKSDEYDSYTDMWLKKMWYEFWRKNQLEQMKNERDDLAVRIKTTEKLIQSIRETIKNLKDAKQWTHDAAQRAKAFENSIEQLSTRLQLAKQDHTAQRAELQAQKASAKENSDRLDEAHKAEMAELARLETGSHDLHSELEKTKEALKAEIDKLEKSIKELQAKIIATDLQIKEPEMERAQAKENAEAKLATLHEQRTALKDSV